MIWPREKQVVSDTMIFLVVVCDSRSNITSSFPSCSRAKEVHRTLFYILRKTLGFPLKTNQPSLTVTALEQQSPTRKYKKDRGRALGLPAHIFSRLFWENLWERFLILPLHATWEEKGHRLPKGGKSADDLNNEQTLLTQTTLISMGNGERWLNLCFLIWKTLPWHSDLSVPQRGTHLVAFHPLIFHHFILQQKTHLTYDVRTILQPHNGISCHLPPRGHPRFAVFLSRAGHLIQCYVQHSPLRKHPHHCCDLHRFHSTRAHVRLSVCSGCCGHCYGFFCGT